MFIVVKNHLKIAKALTVDESANLAKCLGILIKSPPRCASNTNDREVARTPLMYIWLWIGSTFIISNSNIPEWHMINVASYLNGIFVTAVDQCISWQSGQLDVQSFLHFFRCSLKKPTTSTEKQCVTWWQIQSIMIPI